MHIKTTMRYHVTPVKMADIKRKKITKPKLKQLMVSVWRRRNSLTLLVGMQTGPASMENSVGYLQQLKMNLPNDPVIPLVGIFPMNMQTLICKETCTLMFTAALVTKAKIMETT